MMVYHSILRMIAESVTMKVVYTKEYATFIEACSPILSSVGRAPVLYTGGPRFDSWRMDNFRYKKTNACLQRLEFETGVPT